jgi:cytochrome c2
MRDTIPRAAALALVAAVLALGRHAHAQDNPHAGSDVLTTPCAQGHGVTQGRHKTGPSLSGVAIHAAAVPGCSGADALQPGG